MQFLMAKLAHAIYDRISLNPKHFKFSLPSVALSMHVTRSRHLRIELKRLQKKKQLFEISSNSLKNYLKKKSISYV